MENLLKSKSVTLIIGLVVLLTSSCSKGNDPLPNYELFTIPSDVTQLYNKVTDGDASSNVVFLVVQGGPMDALVPKEEFLQTVMDGNVQHAANYPPMYAVHQTQTLNATKVKNTAITFDQITTEAKKSATILQKVIEHFKSQGKTVALWGYSYGFFVIEELLASHPIKFDRAFLGGGRFDMPAGIWERFKAGTPNMFDTDAVTILPPSNALAEDYGHPNIIKFAAGLGQFRYTEKLKNVDLDNVIFYFGAKDQDVGKLSEAEENFLISKSATYKLVTHLGHDIDTYDLIKINQFLMTGEKPKW